MPKTTIAILGPAGSGKTSKLKELTAGKKTVWIEAKQFLSPFYLSEATEETEVIAIEEVNDLQDAKTFIYARQIAIEKRGIDAKIIEKPQIIFTSNVLKPKVFDEVPYVEVINLTTQEKQPDIQIENNELSALITEVQTIQKLLDTIEPRLSSILRTLESRKP